MVKNLSLVTTTIIENILKGEYKTARDLATGAFFAIPYNDEMSAWYNEIREIIRSACF